jgi:hypothetical protein
LCVENTFPDLDVDCPYCKAVSALIDYTDDAKRWTASCKHVVNAVHYVVEGGVMKPLRLKPFQTELPEVVYNWIVEQSIDPNVGVEDIFDPEAGHMIIIDKPESFTGGNKYVISMGTKSFPLADNDSKIESIIKSGYDLSKVVTVPGNEFLKKATENAKKLFSMYSELTDDLTLNFDESKPPKSKKAKDEEEEEPETKDAEEKETEEEEEEKPKAKTKGKKDEEEESKTEEEEKDKKGEEEEKEEEEKGGGDDEETYWVSNPDTEEVEEVSKERVQEFVDEHGDDLQVMPKSEEKKGKWSEASKFGFSKTRKKGPPPPPPKKAPPPPPPPPAKKKEGSQRPKSAPTAKSEAASEEDDGESGQEDSTRTASGKRSSDTAEKTEGKRRADAPKGSPVCFADPKVFSEDREECMSCPFSIVCEETIKREKQ